MFTIILRTVIVYLSIMLVLRLLGKRQLGEMELSEFVVAALMADLAAYPLEDHSVSLALALLPIGVLSLCELLIARLSMRSIRLRLLLFGRPNLLIREGIIDQAEMRRNRFTIDELMQALRGQGILDLSQVRYAVLETNGKLSVIPAASAQPVTAGQMNLPPPEEADYPAIIVSEGRVLDENLRFLGFDRNWLTKKLRENKLSSPDQVFLMTADRSGKLFLEPKAL